MTEPIQPPTESGWYVVEDEIGEVMVGWLELDDVFIGKGGDFSFADIASYWRFEDAKILVRGMCCGTILRYRPIDPKAYLEGKE